MNSTGQFTQVVMVSEPKLPPDIMVQVFDLLQKSKASLPEMRLVSSQFDYLIVPIMYRVVNLSEKMIDTFDQKPDLENWAIGQLHMSLYTRHVMIRKPKDRSLEFLSLGHRGNLQDIRYVISVRSYIEDYTLLTCSLSFLGLSEDTVPMCRCPILYHAEKRGPSNLRLHLVDIDCTSTNEFTFLFSIFTMNIIFFKPMNIVSFKITSWKYRHGTRVMGRLLKMPRLKVLHLISQHDPDTSSWDGDPSFYEGVIGARGQLSAIEELVLHTYKWSHSPHTAVNFWNWTKIKNLELKDVDVVNFLRTVPSSQLTHLQTLILDSSLNDEKKEVTRLVCDLVKKVHALKSLSLKCSIEKVVNAITCHGPSLRCLNLRDPRRRKSLGWTMRWCQNLRDISAACSNLMELVVDVEIDSSSEPAKMVIETLAGFRNMRTLTVFDHKKRFLHARETPMMDHPANRDVSDWLKSMLEAKKGVMFDNVTVMARSRNIDLANRNTERAFRPYLNLSGDNLTKILTESTEIEE